MTPGAIAGLTVVLLFAAALAWLTIDRMRAVHSLHFTEPLQLPTPPVAAPTLPCTAIIAGSYRQAVDWAHREQLRRTEWMYVGHHSVLAGRRDVHVVYVGTWHSHPDLINTMFELDHLHAAGRILSSRVAEEV